MIQWLMNIDRRIIFVFVFLGVALPLLANDLAKRTVAMLSEGGW